MAAEAKTFPSKSLHLILILDDQSVLSLFAVVLIDTNARFVIVNTSTNGTLTDETKIETATKPKLQ